MTVKHFSCEMHGYGWATVSLSDGGRSYSARATNVAPTDAVHDTIVACLALMDGEPNAGVSYFDEPGERRLRLRRTEYHLDLSVLWFPDDTPYVPTDEWFHDNEQWVDIRNESPWPNCRLDFEATVPAVGFFLDVAESMNRIRQQLGLSGYRQKWSADFPADKLTLLAQRLKKGDGTTLI